MRFSAESFWGRRPLPGHERWVRFFGLRLQLVAGIVLAGAVGGAMGTAYIYVLDAVTEGIGPDRWSVAVHSIALVAVGIASTVIVHLVGRPGNVELLVDNIHVPEGDEVDDVRLRAMLPVSLLNIGVGGTLGPEAPVVTTTGTITHRGAERYGTLRPGELRVVTIAGMAAGLAVLFGAPFGAALFALEVPHRRGIGYSEAIIPAVIGATIGSVVSMVFGHHMPGPVWHAPAIDHVARIELAWAVVAGIVGASIAVAFTVVVTYGSRFTERLPPAALTALPVVGGIALAGLAWWSPYALTNGKLQIDDLGIATTAGIAVAATAKFLAASVSVVTGWIGGFIIPLFFMGFACGLIVADLLPGAHAWTFAIGAMAAANVGVTKTPLGSTLVVTEMAGLPMLPTTLIASLVALVLTSPVRLLEAQREPHDLYGASRGDQATRGDHAARPAG